MYTALSGKQKMPSIALVMVLATLVSVLAGCSNSSESSKLATIKESLETQQSIVLKSNGSWNNLSPSDQQVLINGPGYGNVDAAKAYLINSYQRMAFKPVPGPMAHGGNTPAQ